jgi:hypothetical protein
VVPTVSHLAEAAPAAEPLSAAEIAEMKEHLAYIRTYKDALRLKLNAQEDLLVNGRREPADRGVCRHLLHKVDRTVIEHAVAREPFASDPAARARMLAGAIRLTADVGVLLDYLETLAHVRAHAEAAQAFGEVVARIDFESLSAARLARLLQVLTDTFSGHERVQVLFSLLGQPPFQRAFDAAAASLPEAIADVFAPLRAVHLRLHDRADASPPALLARGLDQVLSAPDPVLRAYAEPLRVRLLEMTLTPGVQAELADRAAGVLLASLPRASRVYARLALQRIGQLLARHADDRARSTLDELVRAQPGFQIAARWLAALGSPRVGRVAMTGEARDGRLAPGFWLDGQRAVLVRSAPSTSAARLAAEAEIQASLAVAGVAPVVEHGTSGGIAYVAVIAPGRPRSAQDHAGSPRALVELAAAARILRTLALAGVVLPDAAPVRFVQTRDDPGSLLLADLDGATRAEPSAAAAAHARIVAALAAPLLAAAGADIAPPGPEPDLPTLIAMLDRTALLRFDT